MIEQAAELNEELLADHVKTDLMQLLKTSKQGILLDVLLRIKQLPLDFIAQSLEISRDTTMQTYLGKFQLTQEREENLIMLYLITVQDL